MGGKMGGRTKVLNYTFGQVTVLPGEDFLPPFDGILGLVGFDFVVTTFWTISNLINSLFGEQLPAG
jgi:hypothetical protein